MIINMVKGLSGLQVCKKSKGPKILGYRKASDHKWGGKELVATTRRNKERPHNFPGQDKWVLNAAGMG